MMIAGEISSFLYSDSQEPITSCLGKKSCFTGFQRYPFLSLIYMTFNTKMMIAGEISSFMYSDSQKVITSCLGKKSCFTDFQRYPFLSLIYMTFNTKMMIAGEISSFLYSDSQKVKLPAWERSPAERTFNVILSFPSFT
ncbi:uncharacterized protein LOC117917354 [Vitis riparia]|uniref:uncharacterized protein LOC117917354 n=1 Tax=Vitis riparia TaxID=96939 RepID=UPI00155A05A0|nr:uncharacterized protein LOC117917354 [Vitis riparia]